MGKIFTLDADVKSVITDALDDLITELGKTCRLVYSSRMVACVNCVFDPIGNKSSNRWRNGGPVPFSAGSGCPLCAGVGRQATEQTEDFKFLCAWEPKHFFYPVPNLNVRTPYSIVQTKGYLTDLPKVLRGDHMVFQVPIEGIIRKKYKLSGEPGDQGNIIQDRYFIATWERLNS